MFNSKVLIAQCLPAFNANPACDARINDMGILLYQLLADIVLLAHLAFIAFVLGGGLLLLRWPRLAWLHLPAVVWVVFVEVTGWVCPLTPLENYFRAFASWDQYQGDFVAHYLLALIYPAGLTQTIQLMLAGAVIMSNVIIYTVIIRVRRRARQASQNSSR
jgi:hypothetical protein